MALETVFLLISHLARLVWKSSPQQWWKAGWFIQSFTWWNSIRWSFKSACALNKIGNAFSINNAARFVLLSLDPFADSKKKKGRKILWCNFTQMPNTSGESTIDRPVTEGRFEIWDAGFGRSFLLLWVDLFFFFFFCYLPTMCCPILES